MTERPETTYRVVEVSPVTEESLQAALNERASEGWSFESLHFVMREGSHRPSMAYLFFTRGATMGWRAQGQADEPGLREEASSARRRAEAQPRQSDAAGGRGGPKVPTGS